MGRRVTAVRIDRSCRDDEAALPLVPVAAQPYVSARPTRAQAATGCYVVHAGRTRRPYRGGLYVLLLQRNAGEFFYWSCRHKVVQECHHGRYYPFEEDTGFGVQPPGQEFLQPLGLPAATAIRRLPNLLD